MNRDWTGCSDLPREQFEKTLASALSGELDRAAADAIRDVVLQRWSVSIRTLSRNELIQEASGVARLLRAAKAHQHSEIACTLEIVGRGMTLAASRNDPSSIDSVLMSYRAYGKRMLELIAEEGEDGLVRRQELVKALGIKKKNDSMMSHMLRDFERAGLIFRMPAKGSTPVMVGLDYEGKKLVREKLHPEWIDLIVDALQSLAVGYRKQSTVEHLMSKGFPSRRGAEDIVDAILAIRGIPIRLVRIISELRVPQDRNVADEQGQLEEQTNFGTTQRSTGSHLYPTELSETDPQSTARVFQYA